MQINAVFACSFQKVQRHPTLDFTRPQNMLAPSKWNDIEKIKGSSQIDSDMFHILHVSQFRKILFFKLQFKANMAKMIIILSSANNYIKSTVKYGMILELVILQ